MLATTFIAAGYVKMSVTRDFALILGGSNSRTLRSRNQQLQNHMNSMQDNEGRGLTGGLEIVSDAAESVGWQRLKDDVFRAPNEATLLAVATGIGSQVTLMCYLGVILLWFFYTVSAFRFLMALATIVTFALCGYINGFMTARILKFFQL